MAASLIRHARAGGSSFVGMLLLTACGAALSAPVCGPGEICLDFNDNLMPSGWSTFFVAGSSGNDVQVSNGRLEVGPTSTNGGIYKQLYMTGVTKLTVEYDSEIAFGSGGQMTGATLLKSFNNGVPDFRAGNVTNSVSKSSGLAVDTTFFGLFYQPSNGGSNVSVGTSSATPQYGAFHFNSTFQDGFASLSITNSAGAQVWATNGNVALPGFTLASMPYVELRGLTTGGSNAWIDNVKISKVTSAPVPAPAPRTFGLFIGVQNTAAGSPYTMNGDYIASKQFDDFFATGRGAELLVANKDTGGAITYYEIQQSLARLRSQMHAGDTLILSINGHGYSTTFPNNGQGSDYIDIGTRLYDFQLQQLLAEFDPLGAIRKEVFLDACHSGGFWNSAADPFEVVTPNLPNLNGLHNVYLFASAPEDNLMYYGPTTDLTHKVGFYSQALDDAIRLGYLEKLTPQVLAAWLDVRADTYAPLSPDFPVFFYEGGFGDAVPADPNLLNSVSFSSSDFDLTAPVMNANVPEPQTALLVALAAGLLGRKHRAKIAPGQPQRRS